MIAPVRHVKSRRRYHLSTAGAMYVGVCVFLLIGAVNSQNNLLFAALGLGLAGLVVSGLVSGSSLLGIEIQRLEISETSVGRPMTIRYAVRNTNRLMPAFGLTIEELASEHADHRGADAIRAFVAHVGPGQRVICEAVAWPSTRGQMRLNRLRTSTTFPFGIARKSVTVSIPQVALVLPLSGRVKPGVVRGGESHTVENVKLHSRVGADGEIFGIREYVPGDVPRHIAWRATARTGRLIVTQRVMPQPVRVWIALRVSGRDATRDEQAICIAASLIRRAAREGVGVGLAVPGAGISRPPRTGRWHAMRLLADLARLNPATVSPAPLRLGPLIGASVIAVHAESIVRSWAPPDARHMHADEVRSIVTSDEFAAYLSHVGTRRDRRFASLRSRAARASESTSIEGHGSSHDQEPVNGEASDLTRNDHVARPMVRSSSRLRGRGAP